MRLPCINLAKFLVWETFLYICEKGEYYAYDSFYRWEKDERFGKCDPPIPEDERFDTG